MIKMNGLPQYINELVDSLTLDDCTKIGRLADEIRPPNLVIISGRKTAIKDAFAAKLADVLRLRTGWGGVQSAYCYAPGIETARIPDDEPPAHIVVFASMDDVPKNKIPIVRGRINNLIDGGNVAIVLTASLEELFQAYGKEWVRRLSPITTATSLGDDKTLELREVV